MNDEKARLPEAPRRRRGMWRRLGLVAAATAVAGLSSLLALTSLGGSHLSNAQVTSPTPTSAPWTPPTYPPVPYPMPVWLDASGHAVAPLAPGTIKAPCTHDNFTLHLMPQLPIYPRNTPVVFQYSIVFTGPHPCHIERETVPTVVVSDSARNVVWVQDGKYGASRAYTPVAQLTAAGEALTGDVAWEQDACVFASCPETEVPSGGYTAVVYFPRYGQSQPATVQLGP